MANPALSEVTLKVADAEYILKYSTNAICELEDLLNKGLNEIVSDLARLSTVRAMLWAGLRAKQPDVTIKSAGEIIDKCGMVAATDVIGKALNVAFPPPSKDPNA